MNDNPSKPVTREAVAKAAGVSTGTVSMALRGLSSIRPETRARVEAAAARLGYAANPVAALLAQQGKGGRRQSQLAVGYLVESAHSDSSVLAACAELGLQGHAFRPGAFATPEAASRILWSQGIAGLLVSDHDMPWSEEERQRFEWGRFAVVKLSRGLPDLACHLVRHSAFDYMSMTLTQVVARGYRRIAVLLLRTPSALDDDARFGAVLNFQARKLPPGVTLSWRELPDGAFGYADAGTAAWLRQEQPDAIVVFHWSMIYDLRQMGWDFPGKTALVAVLSSDEKVAKTPLVAGCDERESEHRRRALMLLQDLIARGERGFSAQPMEHVVEPAWMEGETLPPRPALA